MSFELEISEKELAASAFMARLNRKLIATFVEQARTRKLTKQQIADALGIDKSQVSRALRGDANLTERRIGELLWAMGVDGDLGIHQLAQPGNGCSYGSSLGMQSDSEPIDVKDFSSGATKSLNKDRRHLSFSAWTPLGQGG
ncbi:helix-turn-helix domain-containing protein [Ferrimonas balearica]|nr:helix-turn-helix domain-containing protein [Ferrimonas balearica]